MAAPSSTPIVSPTDTATGLPRALSTVPTVGVYHDQLLGLRAPGSPTRCRHCRAFAQPEVSRNISPPTAPVRRC